MTFTPGGESQAGKDHQSMTAENHDLLCVCGCECVGFLARSSLKWPLIVFLYYLIVKKSIPACQSRKDPFQTCLFLW